MHFAKITLQFRRDGRWMPRRTFLFCLAGVRPTWEPISARMFFGMLAHFDYRFALMSAGVRDLRAGLRVSANARAHPHLYKARDVTPQPSIRLPFYVT